MKKFFILLLTAIVAMVAQAQTCKISANKNNGKVIQISVNLDSLKGQTLVTTINQQTDGNVNVQMAYEDDVTVISREDSSAINAEHIEEVDTTGTVTPNLYANNDSEVPSEEPTDSLQNSEPATMVESVLGAFGLGEVGALIGSLTRTNGEPYAEYYAKKITQADTTQYQPVYKKRKWKWLQNYCSYPTLELSGIFGKDFGGDEEEGADDIKEDDYGTTPDNEFNYGGSVKFSQVFIHGHYDADGNFIPNKMNFGWSIGGLFAMDYQKDYGWSYDILAKFGIQGGNGIVWYVYNSKSGHGRGVVCEDRHWKEMTTVSAEIAAFTGDLLSRTAPDQPQVEILSGPARDYYGFKPVSVLLKTGDAPLLATVNAATNAVKAVVRVRGFSRAEVLGEGRALDATDGIVDEWGPYGVRLYRLHRPPAPPHLWNGFQCSIVWTIIGWNELPGRKPRISVG